MKIYHKKNFAAGLLMLGLGVCCLVYVMRAEIIDLGWVNVMAVSLIGGAACVVRSLSREKARSDRVEELDERNRANLQKSKSLAFDMISWGGLAAAPVLTLWDRGNHGPCIYAALGLFFASALGFIAQGLARLYLEKHS